MAIEAKAAAKAAGEDAALPREADEHRQRLSADIATPPTAAASALLFRQLGVLFLQMVDSELLVVSAAGSLCPGAAPGAGVPRSSGRGAPLAE